MSLQYTLNSTFNHRSKRAVFGTTKCREHTLFDIFANHVNLDIDTVSNLLIAKLDLALCMRDQHDAKRAIFVIDTGDGQAGAVEGDKALGNNIRHNRDIRGLVRVQCGEHGVRGRCGRRHFEEDTEGITIWFPRGDCDGTVDVSLDEVASKTRVRCKGTFQGHSRTNFQIAWMVDLASGNRVKEK